MTAPIESKYWEDWATGMGWTSEQVAEAGRVGSLAVRRRMTPPQATDCVLARVRDGRDVRIGRPLIDQLIMDRAFPSIVIGGIVLVMATMPYWNGGFTPGLFAPVGFLLSTIGGLGVAARGLSATHWRVGVVGLVVNLAAMGLMALSLYRA